MCAWKIEEVEGTPALIVTINSNKSNCVNFKFLQDLHECFDILDSKYPQRPIILTSESSSIFSSGMDLKIVGAARTKEESKKIFIEFEKGMSRILTSQRRTIGMINGSALAGGFFLALACDYRVGMTNDKFKYGANEVVLGIPFPTSLEVLKLRISPKNAWNCVLGGKIYNSKEALELGVFDELATSKEDLMELCVKQATVIPMDAMEAYCSIKNSLLDRVMKITVEESPKMLDEFARVRFSKGTLKIMMGIYKKMMKSKM
eukprot:gene3961-7217_t